MIIPNDLYFLKKTVIPEDSFLISELSFKVFGFSLLGYIKSEKTPIRNETAINAGTTLEPRLCVTFPNTKAINA